MKEHEIISCACGPHLSAMITKDGKLLMFGQLGTDEELVVDKSTGECLSVCPMPHPLIL